MPKRFSDPTPYLAGRPADPHAAEVTRQLLGHLSDHQEQLDLITGVNAPTVTVKVAAGSTVTGSCKITGNDVAGVLTLKTGTTLTIGLLLTVTFSKPRPVAPFSVHFSPANAQATGAAVYVDPAGVSATKWGLSCATALASSSTYQWAYRVSSP